MSIVHITEECREKAATEAHMMALIAMLRGKGWEVEESVLGTEAHKAIVAEHKYHKVIAIKLIWETSGGAPLDKCVEWYEAELVRQFPGIKEGEESSLDTEMNKALVAE